MMRWLLGVVFALGYFLCACSDEPVMVYWIWHCDVVCADGSPSVLEGTNPSTYICEDRDRDPQDLANAMVGSCNKVMSTADPCYGTCTRCTVVEGSEHCSR
jgi:hypothetical protein